MDHGEEDIILVMPGEILIIPMVGMIRSGRTDMVMAMVMVDHPGV